MANLQYPNMPPQLFQPQMQPNPAINNMEFHWIQGENAAKAYPIMPGNTGFLMDSESNYFYIKQVAFNGMPNPLRKFKYEEVIEQPNDIPVATEVSNYVTKDDLNKAMDKLVEMMSSMKQNNYSKNRGERNGKSDIRSNE